MHTSSIALVINLAMGYVSSQFHVVFNDQFEIVSALKSSNVPDK